MSSVLLLVLNLILLSICLLWMWSSFIYIYVMESALTLEDRTPLYNLWSSKPLAMNKKIYIFNITNADEFLSGGKMSVEEVGPFTYDLDWRKNNFQWHSNGTLSFTLEQKLRFKPERSFSKDAFIVALNSSMISQWSKDSRGNKTVGSLVMKTSINNYLHLVSYMFQASEGCYFNFINCSRKNAYLIDTGRYLLDNRNSIYGWNGNFLWNSENSWNVTVASSLELTPPLNEAEVVFKFFLPILCRSLIYFRSGQVNSRGYLSARFEVSAQVNGLSDLIPDKLLQLRNITTICPSVSSIITLPHFYSLESDEISSVIGLKPNKTSHISFVDSEIVTGITTNYATRYQFNFRIKDISNIQNGVYPFLWIEDVGQSTAETDSFLYRFVRVPDFVINSSISWILYFICFAVVTAYLTAYFASGGGRQSSDQETMPLLIEQRIVDYSSASTDSQDQSASSLSDHCK